jgi:glycosyltransferase involved in cell wall biosynthesis
MQIRAMPTVSVITIFHNAERFLAEAIDSVTAQSYGDWEMVLVDDGSTDGSARIASDYSNHWPGRIRCVQHGGGGRRGMSASRNLGVAHSTGKYVAFLDADDTWLAAKLERQVAILDAHSHVGMVQGPMLYWYSWSGVPGDEQRDKVDLTGLDFPLDVPVEPPRMFPRYFTIDGPGTVSLMVRRSTFEKVGGFEEAFTSVHEDAAFILKVYLSEAVFVSSECLSRYRQHSGSFSSQAKTHRNWREDYMVFLTWLKSYLAGHDIRERRVWRAVEREEWPLHHPQLYRWRPANVATAIKRRLAALGGLPPRPGRN